MANESIVPGTPATVTALAEVTGGIDAGHFVDTDVDDYLFSLVSSDTPLMNLMLLTKPIPVNSPEVDHYMIDQPVTQVKTVSMISATNQMQVLLPLDPSQQSLPRPSSTLLVHGVNGYTPDGQIETPGKYLMLFVVATDTSTGNPIVRAINGPKSNPADDITAMPKIPSGTVLTILANSLYETQKEVDPDIIVPRPSRVFLQKRGMNQVVSDYFEAQRKRIPFDKQIIAEQAIANFKVQGNRTLWAGRPGKFKVNVPKMGMQYVYTTEGLRWQFNRELRHSGEWTVERLIGLAKLFFTGEDCPKTAILLAGKNLMEEFARCNFSSHPEIKMEAKINRYGWTVSCFHTVFGDIEIKHEPTLDSLNWSNSGALIGEDRIAHYVYRPEYTFSERMEGQEAERSGVIVWDALALKGKCHIWIDGEGSTSSDPVLFMWDQQTPPSPGISNYHFYLLRDCPGIDARAKTGQIWTGVKSYVGSGSDRQEIISWQRLE